MLNPDPVKFTALPEALNALGQSRFGEKWTGAELAARNLPPPKATFRALKDADIARSRVHQELGRERRAKVEKAKKAAAGVGVSVHIARRPRNRPLTPEALEQKKLVEVARYVHLDPEIVTAASNQSTYRKEYKARARRDKAENELRKLLHSEHVPTTLLNNHDGKLVHIPPAHWLANKFTVNFASGQADWADLEEGQRVAYRGFVLIDRHIFDRFVRNTQRLTQGAVTKCTEWARELPPEPVWRKSEFTVKAMKEHPGLSQGKAWEIWAAVVPDKWKQPGRKS